MDAKGLIFWLYERALALLGIGEALLLMIVCIVVVVAILCVVIAALCSLAGVDFWTLS